MTVNTADAHDTTEQLLLDVEKSNTLPLWAQMTRLNPPEPNPTCIPFLWKYKTIRPNLLRAGKLITEKQAERRVLMLINPARGLLVHLFSFIITCRLWILI
jgi:gentisate 1,2-dioxygenase